jgi:hypothetical protein
MAIKLSLGNILGVSVKGVETGETGAPERFEFTLVCKRLNVREFNEAAEGRTVNEFLQHVAEGWKSVLDPDGRPLPFSAGALEELLLKPGLARLAYSAYLREVEAREKN